MASKATLTVCLALVLVAVAQSAVVAPSLEEVTDEQAVATAVVEDIAKEKNEEIGVLAQRTGFLLSQLGSDLEELAQDDERAVTYGFWKNIGKKIKNTFKKVAPKVKKFIKEKGVPKVKELVIKKAGEVLHKKIGEMLQSQSLSEENFSFRDLVSSLGKSLRNLGEALIRKGVQILEGISLDEKLTEAEKKFVSTVVQSFKEE